MSDQRLVAIETMLEFLKIFSNNVPSTEGLGNLNFFSDKTNWDGIARELADVDWMEIYDGKDTTEMYRILVHKLCLICTKYTPSKVIVSKNKTIPRDRKVIMRKRCKLRKLLRDGHPIRQNLQNELDLLEEQLRTSHLNELDGEEQRAVDAIKSNYKYFFKYARAKSELRSAIGPLRQGSELVGD